MFDRNPLPRYAQVADALRNRIRRGIWKRDDAIPSIERLMAEFGVGRVTVRQAILMLAREGLLSPEQGRGTFVAAEPGRCGGCRCRPRWPTSPRCTGATRPIWSISSRTRRRRSFPRGRACRAGLRAHAAGAFAGGQRYCVVSIYIARRVFDLAPERFRGRW